MEILVNRSDDKPYEGDEPYVILEVDQAAQPNLEAFEHELRAGALLKDWTPKIGVDAMEVLKTIGALIKKNEN